MDVCARGGERKKKRKIENGERRGKGKRGRSADWRGHIQALTTKKGQNLHDDDAKNDLLVLVGFKREPIAHDLAHVGRLGGNLVRTEGVFGRAVLDTLEKPNNKKPNELRKTKLNGKESQKTNLHVAIDLHFLADVVNGDDGGGSNRVVADALIRGILVSGAFVCLHLNLASDSVLAAKLEREKEHVRSETSSEHAD